MKESPKRRKDKYNPYSIIFKNKYLIKFKDINNKDNVIEVSKEIYQAFNEFELSDLSQMNKFDRHIEHLKLVENILNNKMINKQLNIEDIVIKKLETQKLHNLILKLPKIQKRRIIMHFFENMTLKEIARKEHCSVRAIQYTINIALKNLKNFLKKTS